MEEWCASFSPVFTPECRVLVLGSMPGAESLRAGAYYAHPRNAFWPILFALWGETPPADYPSRLAFALERGVALWDAARLCRRAGSEDASIRDAVPNDLSALRAQCPRLNRIFYNGQAAARLAMPAPWARCTTLPSTSPAHAVHFDRKLAAWRALREALEQG